MFRHGILDLLKINKELNIPLTIISGGLGDIILAFINSINRKYLNNIENKNIDIYSNKIHFD